MRCHTVFQRFLFFIIHCPHSFVRFVISSQTKYLLPHLLVLVINIMVIVIVVASIYAATRIHARTYLKRTQSPKWRYTYGQHCTYTPTCGRFCGWLLLLVKPQPQAHYEFAVSLSALALALERWIVN